LRFQALLLPFGLDQSFTDDQIDKDIIPWQKKREDIIPKIEEEKR
jgi:hypothetical protein